VKREGKKVARKVVLGKREGEAAMPLLRIGEEIVEIHEDAPDHPHEAIVIDTAPAGSGFLGVYLSGDEEAPVVASVIPGTAAEKAGLQPGDRILAVGDLAVDTGAKATKAIASRAAGDKVHLAIARGDQKMRLKVVLGAREEEQELEPLLLPPPAQNLHEPDIFILPDEPDPERAGAHRAEIERILRELQSRGFEESERWSGAHEDRMVDLQKALDSRSKDMEKTFRELRGKVDGERVQRLRGDLERWGKDRARVLGENTDRIRQLEAKHRQRLQDTLGELRQRGSRVIERNLTEENLREARRRFVEVEDGFQNFIQKHAPEGLDVNLGEVKRAVHGLRAEMEGLRGELQELRRALRQLKDGR